MIPWWWLLVAGAVFVVFAVIGWRITRDNALFHALEHPKAARAEALRWTRWK